jgi:hypothetical protein
MKRAAILIGVDKTGDLPRLKDAAKGAALMKTWADAQGIDSVHLLTDEREPVTLARIKDAVKALVKAGNVGQLLVYFAGHGVSLQRQEYWLLSDAPDDADEAVNVAGSIALAATCGIGHVLLMSDCCRTAPEGVRAQSVRGGLIFPNLEADERPVDQFFACQLGKPSLEVRDPAITSAEFQALYTHELVPALLGRAESVVQWSGEGAARVGRVHLRPLRDHMAAAVAARLEALDLKTKPIQVPVASIASDPPAWISQLKGDSPVARGRAAPAPQPAPVVSPQAATTELLLEALGTQPSAAGAPPPTLRARSPITARVRPTLRERMGAEVTERAKPFGPGHHETRCGFKLRGALATEAIAADGSDIGFVTASGPRGSDLRVQLHSPRTSVLIVLERGAAVLLPAIPDFLCALSFDEDDGELLDVAWEPSDNSGWRWDEFSRRAREIRTLRAIASAAMARGSFQLEGQDTLALAQRMQLGKGLDPALGLYAAYAYHELQRRPLIRDMAGLMASDLGAPLFDIALLARALDGKTLGRGGTAPPTLAMLPLLSQGWTLLRAFEVRLPKALAPLVERRLPSLWTMFDAQGARRLRELIQQGEIT